MTTRRSFLATLAALPVAGLAIARALASPLPPPPASTITLFGCTTRAQAKRAALWYRQCGWKSNPAWVMYNHLVATHGPAAVDHKSFARLAAYCDEPVKKI
jgi:cytochrome b561